jgi:hypothetical protein
MMARRDAHTWRMPETSKTCTGGLLARLPTHIHPVPNLAHCICWQRLVGTIELRHEMQVPQAQPAAASSWSDAAVAARHPEFTALTDQAAEPAPAQPRQRGVDLNVASDLNDILAERDACGVRPGFRLPAQ